MPLRVLFLDVDGVITVADGSGRLDEAKMGRLQALVLVLDPVVGRLDHSLRRREGLRMAVLQSCASSPG